MTILQDRPAVRVQIGRIPQDRWAVRAPHPIDVFLTGPFPQELWAVRALVGITKDPIAITGMIETTIPPDRRVERVQIGRTPLGLGVDLELRPTADIVGENETQPLSTRGRLIILCIYPLTLYPRPLILHPSLLVRLIFRGTGKPACSLPETARFAPL
jgi:hypothetical protein